MLLPVIKGTLVSCLKKFLFILGRTCPVRQRLFGVIENLTRCIDTHSEKDYIKIATCETTLEKVIFW